jgi:hypothetical protein
VDPELDLIKRLLAEQGVNRQVGQTFGVEDAGQLDRAVDHARVASRESLARRDPEFQDLMSILVQIPDVGGGLRDDLIDRAAASFRGRHSERADSLIAEAIGLPANRAQADLHDSSLAFWMPAAEAHRLRARRDGRNETRAVARREAREAEIAQQSQNLQQHVLLERKDKNVALGSSLFGAPGAFIANLLTR